MFDDVIPCINGDLRVKLESTKLKQQSNPVEYGMIAVQQVKDFQPLGVKIVDVDKAVRVLLTSPLTSHLIDSGAIEAHAVVVVGITDIDIRNLNDVISSMK